MVSDCLDNNFTEGRGGRQDGWTPERKRLFHERLADCGVVAEAARAAGMNARSAYTLRNRDRLFDAGWEAALLLARRRLADDLYARAVNGCVDRIHRDGAIVAERHRYDNRLSMAVLARLDVRLDRAEARGDGHANVAARWDEYLDALGGDRADDARALADPAAVAAEAARHRELREAADARAIENDDHWVWRDDEDKWWTDYPPPPGFDAALEQGRYGDDGNRRPLTAEEGELVDVAKRYEAVVDDAKPAGHRQRDAFFGCIRRQNAADAKDAERGAATPPVARDGEATAGTRDPLAPEADDARIDPATPEAAP